MSIDADREGVESNPHERVATTALRAAEHYDPDPPDIAYDMAAWRLRNDEPEPPDPWDNA